MELKLYLQCQLNVFGAGPISKLSLILRSQNCMDDKCILAYLKTLQILMLNLGHKFWMLKEVKIFGTGAL